VGVWGGAGKAATLSNGKVEEWSDGRWTKQALAVAQKSFLEFSNNPFLIIKIIKI
jgi:hypothetical protein